MENADTQDMMECPYEKHHQILKSRMQVHLTRCRRNHTDVKKTTCPFNTTHILNEPELKTKSRKGGFQFAVRTRPKIEMTFHVTICTERKSFEHFRNTVEITTRPTIPPPMPVYQSEDNWDDENVATYNPHSYTSKADVLRSIQGAPPAQRKAFRKQERLRLLGINN